MEAVLGGYEAAERQPGREQLEVAYTELAKLLNCEPSSIGVVNSATAAWQRIFLGLPLWQPGSRIITSVAEYGSNYIAYLQAAKRFDTTIQVVDETPGGDIDTAHLERLLSDQAAFPGFTVVSLSHIPTSSGRVYDAEAVGRCVARHPGAPCAAAAVALCMLPVLLDRGVVYLLDACQTVGQLPIDVRRVQCHFLTATGRKYMRGPRGSGFLYASPDALLDTRLEPAALDVRGARWLAAEAYEAAPSARRYEEYEMSFAAKVGLGVACALINKAGIAQISARALALAASLREQLAALPRVRVHDRGQRLCAIVSFTMDCMTATDVKAELARFDGPTVCGVHVSVSTANSSRLDFNQRSLQEVVRASPHHYNTEAEVDVFVSAVQSLSEQRSQNLKI